MFANVRFCYFFFKVSGNIYLKMHFNTYNIKTVVTRGVIDVCKNTLKKKKFLFKTENADLDQYLNILI